MNIFKKNTEKHTEKLPMTGKVKKGFRIYCTAVMGAALVLGTSVTAFAANDPITVINNLSTFKLTEIKSSTEYDDLEMSGSRAVWKEVLAVYAVKINTDPDNPQEVASMDDTKKQLLSDIFWEMNEVSSRTESKTETVIEESDDGNGNIVETETTETKTILYITVSHKTVDEMADQYGKTRCR